MNCECHCSPHAEDLRQARHQAVLDRHFSPAQQSADNACRIAENKKRNLTDAEQLGRKTQPAFEQDIVENMEPVQRWDRKRKSAGRITAMDT